MTDYENMVPAENILETIKELGDGMQAKIYLAKDN